MKSCASISLLLGALIAGSIANAKNQRIVCPAEIPASSIQLAGIPAPWKAHVAAPMLLSSAGATAGPPEQKAVLMGSSTWKKGATSWTTIYDLTGDGFPEGKWMECRYGEYDQISLSMKLADKTTSCKVQASEGGKAGQKTVRILCS